MSDSSSTSDIKGVLSTKFAGMPVWVWGGILAAIVILIAYVRRANGTSTVGVSTDAGTVAGDGSLDSSLSGAGGLAAGSTTTGGGSPTLNSNPSWIAAAVESLTGYQPLQVEQALTDLLNGNPLSATEQQIANAAITNLGSPPEGLPQGVGSLSGSGSTSGTNNWLTPGQGSFYTRNATTGEIDLNFPDGTIEHLDPEQWAVSNSQGLVKLLGGVTGYTGSSSITPYEPGQFGAPVAATPPTPKSTVAVPLTSSPPSTPSTANTISHT